MRSVGLFSRAAFVRACLVVSVILTLPTQISTAQFGGNVNEYADRCACELGGGEGAYMPEGIDPYTDPSAKEIPIRWNRKRVMFTTVDANGDPDPGGTTWEYVFLDDPDPDGTQRFKKGVANVFPDTDNTIGRIAAIGDLKCDRYSLLAAIPGWCVPGQITVQKEVGGVTWTFLFRRTQPPKPGQVAWDEHHPYYFRVMDVNALKDDTGGTCWFDTLQRDGIQVNNWWNPPAPLPAGVPRPGGKDTDKKARAQAFWDTPAQLTDCIQCHGNGPALSSRWINQEDGVGSGDDTIPYWNAAGLMPNLKHFTVAGAGVSCGGCHTYWGQGAQTCPGGAIAEASTPSGSCAGGPTPLAACKGDGDCGAGGTCAFSFPPYASKRRKQEGIAPQEAGIMFDMPDPFTGTPAAWETQWKAKYNAMKDCCLNNAGCGDLTDPVVPNFYGPQDAVPADPNQLISPPDQALNFTVSRINCIVAGDGSETCDYRIEWDDPMSDVKAPARYYLEIVSGGNMPTDPDPVTTPYCTSNALPAGETVTPIAGSNWRKHHSVVAAMAACKKYAFRLCGAHCDPPKESRDIGQTGLLRTACAGSDPDPCIVPDDGTGTAALPPVGCPYLSPGQVHMIIEGLPSGTTVELAPVHLDFINTPPDLHKGGRAGAGPHPPPGGTLGGEYEEFTSRIRFLATGTGMLAGYQRTIDIPSVFDRVSTAPRTRGAPVQSFAAEMNVLNGQLPPGDPDFALLRVQAGTTFGLPAPGHVTLTRQPNGSWAVDSFFDITYRIEFVGAAGGPFAGRAGTTTGTIRMGTTPQNIPTLSEWGVFLAIAGIMTAALLSLVKRG